MSPDALIGLLVGPFGGTILAVLMLRSRDAQALSNQRALESRYEAEIARLTTLLEDERRESREARALLDAEHAARLLELRATKRELLELTDRTYATIDHLRRYVESVTPGPTQS